MSLVNVRRQVGMHVCLPINAVVNGMGGILQVELCISQN